MATHSSVLAWRTPGTGEPGGLPSLGSHGVRHDWSDLAAARWLPSLVLHFHWFLCHQQRGCPDQPQPGGQRRRPSVHPLLKHHPLRATRTSATPPSCLGGCPRLGTCVGRGKEMAQILPLAIKISLVWGGFPSSRSGAAKNRVRCSCTL